MGKAIVMQNRLEANSRLKWSLKAKHLRATGLWKFSERQTLRGFVKLGWQAFQRNLGGLAKPLWLLTH